MTRIEQAQSARPRRMSEVLWDLFTGSASYRDVFIRTLHPKYIGHLIWNLAAGNLLRKNNTDHKDVSNTGGTHGIH
jgi:Na+/serine symporter